jgi:hypothetical protein
LSRRWYQCGSSEKAMVLVFCSRKWYEHIISFLLSPVANRSRTPCDDVRICKAGECEHIQKGLRLLTGLRQDSRPHPLHVHSEALPSTCLSLFLQHCETSQRSAAASSCRVAIPCIRRRGVQAKGLVQRTCGQPSAACAYWSSLAHIVLHAVSHDKGNNALRTL